jgi:hypothetical protein
MGTAKPTLPVRYSILPQYAAETTQGTPNANAAYKLAGYTQSITPDYQAEHQDDALFGKYDWQSSVQLGRIWRWTIVFSPYDGDLLKRGTLLPAGAGTAEEALTFVEGTLINGVLNYRLHYGSIISSVTGQINRGGFRMTHTYESTDVSDWITAHGLTSPDFVTLAEVPTTDPWSHLTPGTDPITIAGTATDIQDIRWDINWNLAKMQPNGVFSYKYAEVSSRRVTLSLTAWLKNNLLRGYVKNYTKLDVAVKLNSGGTPLTFTFKDCVFDRYAQPQSAGGNAFATETITGMAINGIVVTGTG